MIESVGDFLNVIDKLYPEYGYVFFRGQSSSDFDISSSVFRFISRCGRAEIYNNPGIFSSKVFERFEERIPAYSESSCLKNHSNDTIDILMTAQHYGMPTRLIDLSNNPLVALYFAAETENDAEYMSVFIFKSTEESDLIVSSSRFVTNEIKCDRSAVNNSMAYIIEGLVLIRNCFIEEKDRSKECIKIISDVIVKIKNERDKKIFLDGFKGRICFQNSELNNFIELSNGIITKLSNLAIDLFRNNNFETFEREIGEIIETLRKTSFNHINGPAGVDIYGKNHLIIEPLPINNRIKNQQGFFLFSKKCGAPEFESNYFVDGKNSINSIDGINDDVKESGVVKINIRRIFAKKIMKELSRYGIKKSFIYPELALFSEEVKENILSGLEC